MSIANKNVTIQNKPGPEGVRGRNSDNTLMREKLNWAPSAPLNEGLKKTYEWINSMVNPST
jgi:nucleoside-diphosphate-sugar epimerase